LLAGPEEFGIQASLAITLQFQMPQPVGFIVIQYPPEKVAIISRHLAHEAGLTTERLRLLRCIVWRLLENHPGEGKCTASQKQSQHTGD